MQPGRHLGRGIFLAEPLDPLGPLVSKSSLDGGAWMAPSVDRVPLDLRVGSLNPMSRGRDYFKKTKNLKVVGVVGKGPGVEGLPGRGCVGVPRMSPRWLTGQGCPASAFQLAQQIPEGQGTGVRCSPGPRLPGGMTVLGDDWPLGRPLPASQFPPITAP